jgi:hypothetical protein
MQALRCSLSVLLGRVGYAGIECSLSVLFDCREFDVEKKRVFVM